MTNKNQHTTKRIANSILCAVLSVVLLFSMVPVSSAYATNTKSKTTTEQTTGDDASSTDSQQKEAEEAGQTDTKTDNLTPKTSEETSSQEKEAETNGSDSSPKTYNLKPKTSEAAPEEAEPTQNSAIANIAANSEVNAAASLAAAATYTEDMYQGTVRVATGKYCGTLDEAIEYLNANGGGTAEVYKDTTLSAAHAITANITIKNITEGITSDVLNPTKNNAVVDAAGHAAVNVTAGGSIAVEGGTLTIKGAVFQGTDARGTTVEVKCGAVEKTHAAASPFIVKTGGTVAVVADDTTPAEDTGVTVSTNTFTGFNTTAGDGGGVFFIGGGTVNFADGVASGNTAGAGGGGVFKIEEAGTLNITGGTFTGNTGTGGGGVVSTHMSDAGNTSTISVISGTFSNNTATGSGGGAIFLNASANSVTTISGGTFTGNHAEEYGSAIDLNYGKLYINGETSIEGNDGPEKGAVYVGSNAGKAYCYLSGSPRIVNNSGKNLYVALAANLIVEAAGLEAKARVGISGLVATGTDFCTTTNTFATTPYMACFSNDTNNTLIPAVGSSTTKAKWIEVGNNVCYITHAGITTYYETLAAAITAALEDDTIEIFKDNTHAAASTINVADVTIKNVDDPLNDGVDWSLNGNAHSPITTFTAAGRLTYGDDAGNAVLEGVIFDGGGTARAVGSGVVVNDDVTLDVNDGQKINNAHGDEIYTATELRNFYNNNQTAGQPLLTGGGFLLLYGRLNFNGGTISGCKSYCGGWLVGGGAAIKGVGENAYVYINGGIVTGNGFIGDATVRYGDSPIYLYKGNLEMVKGEFYGNTAGNGGAICSGDYSTTDSIIISGGSIHNNTSNRCGGAINVMNRPGYGAALCTVTITNNAKIYENYAKEAGSAICSYYGTTSAVTISGSAQIYDNWTDNAIAGRGCAIEGAYGAAMGVMTISGNPIVWGNTRGDDTPGNVNPAGSSNLPENLLCTALGKGAKVGYYSSNANLIGVGCQFGKASDGNTAAALKNIAGSFINDTNTDLISIVTVGSDAITWGTAVVKETVGETGTGDFVKYYDSLNTALTNVTSGNTLEILKSHALTGDATLAAAKTCYIRNVVNPANDTENPFKTEVDGKLVYDADAEPVVYFAKAGTARRLTISGTCTIEGVKFSGQSWTGVSGVAPVANNRTTSGILVSAGANLTINNGPAGTLPDSTDAEPNVRTACETVIENFVNTSSTVAASGGVINSSGNVTLENGKIRNNKCSAASTIGGGAVLAQNAGGNFVMNNGDVYLNQGVVASGWACGPFQIYGGTFTMNNGKIRNNTAPGCGGAIFTGLSESETGTTSTNKSHSSGQTVYIKGGEISGNSCTVYDGGAFQIGSKATFYVNTDSSSLLITKNQAERWSGVANIRAGGKMIISGSPRIIKNDCIQNTGVMCSTIYPQATGAVTVSGSPVIYGNTIGNGSVASDIGVNTGKDYLKVGEMGAGAKVGIYTVNDATKDAGDQFATSNLATAAACKTLTAFYNTNVKDANGEMLRGADGGGTIVQWASVTPTVKVTETETTYTYTTNADGTVTATPAYTDIIHTFGGTTAIADAFACVAALPAGNAVASDNANRPYQEYFPIELLYATHDDYKLTSQVAVATGDRKVMLTTAMTEAQQTATGMTKDGYYYPSDAAVSYATVVRGSNFDKALFYLTASNVTVQNLTVDGDNIDSMCEKSGSNYRGNLFFNDVNSTLTLEDKTTLTQAKTTSGYGGAIYSQGTLVLNKGSKIEKCQASAGGAIKIIAGKLTMTGATIDNCTGTSNGGGISVDGTTTITIGGESKITSNTSANGGALYITGGAKATVNICDQAQITQNKTTRTDVDNTNAPGAIGMYYSSRDNSKYVLSGDVYIYNNWDASGEDGGVQRNLFDSSNATDATTGKNQYNVIYVAEEGLGKDSKIGILSVNNPNALDTFARTVAEKSATSTNAVNLQNFINDKDTSLTGTAGEDDEVEWGKYIPLNIVVTQEKTVKDRWYTLQLQNAVTGARTRLPLKVPANSAQGSVVAMVQAGQKYYVSEIEDGSAYGYTLAYTSYVNTADTGKGGVAHTGTDEKSDSTSFICGITVDSVNANKGNTATTSGLRELTLASTWASPNGEVTKLMGQSGVTNTLEAD